jgi:hypothetical protein
MRSLRGERRAAAVTAASLAILLAGARASAGDTEPIRVRFEAPGEAELLDQVRARTAKARVAAASEKARTFAVRLAREGRSIRGRLGSEQSLLRAAREDRPSPGSRQRALAALGIGAGVIGAGATVSAAAAASTATPAMKAAASLGLLEWIGVGIAGGALVGGAAEVVRSVSPSPADVAPATLADHARAPATPPRSPREPRSRPRKSLFPRRSKRRRPSPRHP